MTVGIKRWITSLSLTCLVCSPFISIANGFQDYTSHKANNTNISLDLHIDIGGMEGRYIYPINNGQPTIARQLMPTNSASTAEIHNSDQLLASLQQVLITSTIPSWDWRFASIDGVLGDWTTPVKDQGSIGSCWAFAVLGVLETVINIQEVNPDYDVDLSEQYLVSCFAGTASGSLAYGALDFMYKKAGALLESCFPYAADKALLCSTKCDDWVQHLIPLSGYGRIDNQHLIDVQNYLVKNGPIAGCFDVYADFLNYSAGVYRYREGKKLGGHCVAIIGFDNDQRCWICKNSWGLGWGERGYFRIGYGECAIGDTLYCVDYQPDSYNRQPLRPASPSGTTMGNTTTLYFYKTNAFDPDGDSLFYQYDWGDGSVSDWLGPIPANETAGAYHQWSTQGQYQIRMRSCDMYGYMSLWSDSLNIYMPIEYSTYHLWYKLFSWFTNLLGGRGLMSHT